MAPAVEVDSKFHLDLSLVARYTVVPAFSEIVFSLAPAWVSVAVTTVTVVAWTLCFQPLSSYVYVREERVGWAVISRDSKLSCAARYGVMVGGCQRDDVDV